MGVVGVPPVYPAADGGGALLSGAHLSVFVYILLVLRLDY